jgi:phosphoribosylamine--glycine ligase
VYICRNREEAEAAVKDIMIDEKFGKSGEKLLVEEYLEGLEATFMAYVDGRRILPMVTSMDYKKALEGDKGKNTGGMGAISPAPKLTKNLFNIIMKTIIQPTVLGLKYEGKEFRGVLYAGLMLTDEGPKVLEFNCRFGDPETQVVLMRQKSDLVDLLEAVAEENLIDVKPEWDENVAGCVVLAAKGYPGKFETGKKIEGLERAKSQGVEIFHAGTYHDGKNLYSNGGRVLNVCAKGETLKEAMETVYNAMSFVSFDGSTYRKDIGWSKK